MKALAIGGSKHIGYFTATRLLEKGWKVTFLLRNPSVFDKDEVIKQHIEQGNAKLVKGDALIRDDVKHAWDEAISFDNQPVDLLVFTVGTMPNFRLTKGFVIDPPNLCTACLMNAICTMPQPTKVITVSAIGIVHASYASLPWIYKPLYSFLIHAPHVDKMGMERLAAYCTGREWSADDPEPTEEIMGPGEWTGRDGLPGKGALKDIVVVRPSLLTDGACYAETAPSSKKKKPYRVSDGEISGAYTISRKDVAHFIVEDVIQRWEEYRGKCISVTY